MTAKMSAQFAAGDSAFLVWNWGLVPLGTLQLQHRPERQHAAQRRRLSALGLSDIEHPSPPAPQGRVQPHRLVVGDRGRVKWMYPALRQDERQGKPSNSDLSVAQRRW